MAFLAVAGLLPFVGCGGGGGGTQGSLNGSTGSWEAALEVDRTNVFQARNPSLAMDGTGNALVAWYQYSGPTASDPRDIWVNRFSPGPWQNGGTVESLPGDAILPTVALNATGQGAVAWQQNDGTGYRIHASRYIPGSGYTAPEVISGTTAAAVAAYGTAVGVDASGNVMTTWIEFDGTYGHVWSARYLVGSGWTAPVKVDANLAEDVTYSVLATDAQGNAVAAWHQTDGGGYYSAWVARFTPAGGWTAPVRLGSGESFNPAVAAANGGALVAFAEAGASSTQTWTRRWGGAAWGAGVQVSRAGVGNTSDAADLPLVGMDAAGNGLLVWVQDQDPSGAVWDLMGARMTSSGTWESPRLMESGGGDVLELDLAVSTSGMATLVWTQVDGAALNSVFGSHFTLVAMPASGTLLETSSAGHAYHPRAAASSNGDGMAVWYQLDGAALRSVWGARVR